MFTTKKDSRNRRTKKTEPQSATGDYGDGNCSPMSISSNESENEIECDDAEDIESVNVTTGGGDIEEVELVSDESEDERECEDDAGSGSLIKPIFKGSNQTCAHYLVDFVGTALRNHVSDAASEALYTTNRKYFPETPLPRTYATARKKVDGLIDTEIVTGHTYMCGEGHDLQDCQCAKPVRSSVVKFDVEMQVKQLKTKYKDEMEDYKTEMARTSDYADAHQGALYKDAVNSGLTPVSMYTDGGRYAKSGTSECWVLILTLLDLPPKLRFAFANIVFVGLWFGIPKPNWDAFFAYVDIEIIAKAVRIVQIIADIPARQGLIKMINVPGYFCCFKCTLRGEKRGHLATTYEAGESTERTYEDFLSGEGLGMRGRCMLCDYVYLPFAVTIDAMHGVYLGFLRDDVKRVFDGFKVTADVKSPKLHAKHVNDLNKLIENQRTHWSIEFERKVRSTKHIGYWKCTEWKQFILYLIPTFFLQVMCETGKDIHRRQAISLLRACAFVRILIQQRITPEELTVAQKLIEKFLDERTEIWSLAANTFKSHELNHIVDQVRLHGPLQTHSAFGGENVVGIIGRLITCKTATVSAKQIRERLSLLRKTEMWAAKHGDEALKKAMGVVRSPHEFVVPRAPDMVKSLIGERNLIAYTVFDHFVLRPNCNDSYIAYDKNDGTQFGKILAIVSNGVLVVERLNTTDYISALDSQEVPDVVAGQCFKNCAYLNPSEPSIVDAQGNVVMQEVMPTEIKSKCVFLCGDGIGYLMSIPHPFEHS